MDSTFADAGAVGVILGWTQVVKGIVPDSWTRFLPICAILLGIVYSMTLRPGNKPWPQAALAGLMLGFSAAGAFSGTKNLFQKAQP